MNTPTYTVEGTKQTIKEIRYKLSAALILTTDPIKQKEIKTRLEELDTLELKTNQIEMEETIS